MGELSTQHLCCDWMLVSLARHGGTAVSEMWMEHRHQAVESRLMCILDKPSLSYYCKTTTLVSRTCSSMLWV